MKYNLADYKSRSRKNCNFSKISLIIIFLRNIHTGVLSIEDANREQSQEFKELSCINKGQKQSKTNIF